MCVGWLVARGWGKASWKRSHLNWVFQKDNGGTSLQSSGLESMLSKVRWAVGGELVTHTGLIPGWGT